MALDGVGSVFAALGTFAGIWAVVLLFRWFQRDFAAVYRLEVNELRARLDHLETELEHTRAMHQSSLLRIGHLERELVRNGLAIPDSQ